MASICDKRLTYLRNGVAMLEMTKDNEKRLIYVGNDVNIWKMA